MTTAGTQRTGSASLPLAVVVLTLNEERHLTDCLRSVAPLGALVLVVDSGSSDGTVAVARAAGAEVVTHPFAGFASQRSAALTMVEEPWVLFLDADERLTPALAGEIAATVCAAPAEVAGYWIARRNRIRSREMRGGGWWPDAQLRLLRRGRARYRAGREVHETVDLDGTAGRLVEPMLHLNYDSLAEFRAKQAGYARLRVEQLLTEGQQPRARTYLGQPAREIWRRLVTLRGYRDGWLGVALAVILGWYELRTWLWLRDALWASAREASVPTLAPAAAEVDLSIVIVSYNVRDLLLACLASIEASLRCSALSAEVIVVDNASRDGTVAAVRERFPDARIVEVGGNVGFARGSNLGVARARGSDIVLLNPDTVVVGNALAALIQALNDAPDVGVVGPRVLRLDGSTQQTRRRFPTLATGLVESTIVQDYWRDNAILRRYYVADRPDNSAQEVDWLVGACLAARREVFEQAGLFDEGFFMYSEEVEWCHRVRSAGWRVVYNPEAVIVHYEGASSGQDVPSRQIAFDTSKVLLFDRLHGRAAARLLRTFLLGSYAVRIAIEGGKGVLGHKRGLRRARVGLYLRALRSGLRPTRTEP